MILAFITSYPAAVMSGLILVIVAAAIIVCVLGD